MMVRAARNADLGFIVNACMNAAQKHMPYVKPDKSRICDVATHLIRDRRSEIFISLDSKESAVGLLAVSVVDTNWTRKKVCEVLAWVGEKPGSCAATMKEAMAWAKDKPASAGLAVALPCAVSGDMAKLLDSFGFARFGHIFFNDFKR